MDRPIWQPNPEQTGTANMELFTAGIVDRHGIASGYESLHAWSVRFPEDFWSSVWDFCGVIGDKGEKPYLVNGDLLPGASWFPNAQINFSENLLRCRDERTALEFRGEDRVRQTITYRELYEQVSLYRQALEAAGVEEGDRVVAYMPNIPLTVITMLAVTSMGAIWSSCSPDFGVDGVVDRFGQIAPKLLFSVNGYFYSGKIFDLGDRLTEILGEVSSIKKAVVFEYTNSPFPSGVRFISGENFIAGLKPSEIYFKRRPFNYPSFILYSSGTTGVPKCIVHGAGGTLLQHLKEHQLHTDLQSHDRMMYFTTCGWMMWNWLVSGLATGATLLLYDGSPFFPNGNVLFDFIDEAGMTIFGTSAKFIDAVKKADLVPRNTHNLNTLRSILSTGSPLSPESFDFVYDSIKEDVCLSSITGGTDLISCFALGNPTLPVWRGEIQCKGLGMAVDVFDSEGGSIREEKGELVCTKPFPSMPIGFWNDDGGRKYKGAYFERYSNVWHHGDYVELTAHNGFVMLGRSDAVLNPGGVRIGTAEIYRQVEQLDEVLEGLVIGQQWEDDIRVILFVKLRDSFTLDGSLVTKIKNHIRKNATPRHVPSKVVQVGDIPRTKSGKIVELAVRDIVHGKEIKNKEALANPEALEFFTNLVELRS